MSKQRFMTIRQTAARGVLPEYTLRQMAKQGKLPGIFSGKRFLINVPMLEKYLDEMSKVEEDER